MNTTLSAPPGRHENPLRPRPPSVPARTPPRVRLIDRVALHLGVALIAWSRRPRVRRTREESPDRASLTLVREEQLARSGREREAELRLLFTMSQWRA